MAFARRTKPSLMSSIGQKVKQGAEMLGTIKGIYDTGKVIYNGVQAAAPYVAPIVAGLI